MTSYSVLAVTPTSQDWIPDYTRSVGALVARHGGKYLARTASHERLEGEIGAFNLTLNPGRRPDEQAHWALILSQVRQEIDRLPENQRQTLILHFEEGMTYEQVGEALNIDIGTVKSRIFYGRKALRRRLGDELLNSLATGQEKD